LLGLLHPFGQSKVEEIELARTWRRAGPPAIAESARLAPHAAVDLCADPELAKLHTTRWIVSDLDGLSQLPDGDRAPVEKAVDLAAQAGLTLRAGANFPLTIRDRGIGFFLIYRTVPGPFSETSLRLYRMLSDQAAGSLERAWLLQEAQRRADHTRLISETTSRMRQSLDVETVLNTAANEIGRALGLAAVDVRLSTELLGVDTSDPNPGNGGTPQGSGVRSREEE
jgi:GAF domain-containing protein